MAEMPVLLSASLASVLLVLLSWAAPPSVLAHAELRSSTPSDGAVLAVPPVVVRLTFSEPVDVTSQSIIILAPSGRNATRGPIQVQGSVVSRSLSALERGTYIVRWSVISDDTHPASGSFVFSVGTVGGVWAGASAGSSVLTVGLGLQVLARMLHSVGYALGFGSFTFSLLVLRRRSPLSAHLEQRLIRLVMAGTVLLLVAEPLALLAVCASLGTGAVTDGAVVTAVMASSFGRVLAQRLGAALLLWALIGLVKAGIARASPAILVLGGILALIDTEASHAGGADPVWFSMGITALHVAAMGVWVGGLAGLICVWSLIQPTDRRSVMTRFGRFAATAVVLLAVTGVVLAWQHLVNVSDVAINVYGRTLLIKVFVVGCAMLLAMIGLRTHQSRRGWWWRWELATLLVVLVFAGALVSLAPPR